MRLLRANHSHMQELGKAGPHLFVPCPRDAMSLFTLFNDLQEGSAGMCR